MRGLLWSRLYRLQRMPLRLLLLPAIVGVPLVALAFVFLERQQQFPGGPSSMISPDIVRQIRLEYSPIMFWYYIAGVMFTAFICVVEVFCPEQIKRYGDLDGFIFQISRLAQSLPGIEEKISGDDQFIRRWAPRWNEMDRRLPVVRFFAGVLASVPITVVGYGFFVYLPARVFRYDSFVRLFKEFILLGAML